MFTEVAEKRRHGSFFDSFGKRCSAVFGKLIAERQSAVSGLNVILMSVMSLFNRFRRRSAAERQECFF